MGGCKNFIKKYGICSDCHEDIQKHQNMLLNTPIDKLIQMQIEQIITNLKHEIVQLGHAIGGLVEAKNEFEKQLQNLVSTKHVKA